MLMLHQLHLLLYQRLLAGTVWNLVGDWVLSNPVKLLGKLRAKV